MLKITFKNYIYTTLNLITGTLIPFITFPYISRIFGPDTIGKINFANSFVYYFVHLASFGITTYGLREISKIRKNKDEVNEVANEIININLVFSLLSFFIYLFSIHFSSKLDENKIILYIYSISILFNFLNIDWIFSAYEDFKYITQRTIIFRIIITVLIFLLIKRESDYVLYVFLLMLSDIGIKFYNVIHSKNFFKLKFSFKKLNLEKHFRSMAIIFIIRIIGGIASNLDKLMLGFIKTNEEVGIYSVGIKIIFLLIPFIEAIGIVTAPKISEMVKEEKNDELKIILKDNYNMIMFLSIPMIIGLFTVTENLIVLLAGDKFLKSGLIMNILLSTFLLVPLADFFGNRILLNYNMEKELLNTSILVALANIVFNLILIPRYNSIGAAIATLISYFVSLSCRYFYSRKIIKIKIISLYILKYLLFSSTFIFFKKILKISIESSVEKVLIHISMCILTYGVLLIISKDRYVYEFMKLNKGKK